MRPNRYTLIAVFLITLSQVTLPAFSQLGISFDLKKPKDYDDRVLRSERSEEKKFTLPKRFIQNTVTHYNYYFNANNKLNESLERAKSAFTDDYSQLLPFYNYTLDATAQDSVQLDSITYKASTGIALHDLRNDWIDNLYLLWGAAYYLQKKFDSAYLMFQFINYAFAPKEKDGYYLTIGSSRDGNSAYSISTKEKKSLPRKVFSEPPSRNDAFIWQIRNFLVQDQFAEAASLIVTLRNDPNFPKRLQNDLHEVQAFWFYKQNMWDSAATHLVEALGNATNLQEKARWEYLAAQLYEMTGKNKESEKYYGKVSGHTTDPVLDIYARLSAIRVNKDGDEKTIDRNVAELLKMAKRDKYEEYQDIIYYMAAQMQLEGKNIDEAFKLFEKSTKFASNNPAQRNKAFLQLAELSFARKQYRQAYNFYDSLRLDDPTLKDLDAIQAKKSLLANLVNNIEAADRQDSLQRVAAMPEDQRKDFVKKIVKDIRKSQGLKDEPLSAGPSFVTPTLFPSVQPKGEWYFYNAAFRTKGQSDFKAKWGNRPNTDNWRRNATINAGVRNPQSGNLTTSGADNIPAGDGSSFEDLYGKLPLTPEQMQKSNDSLQAAWFAVGKIYVQEMEDCNAGIETFEQLRARFPQFEKMEELLFNLYYCYDKNGDKTKAFAIKKLMNEKFNAGKLTAIVVSGKDPKKSADQEATKAYEKIYDLFIEGKFEQALMEKKAADNLYGKNYWTPQLLYIESIYYIKQRNDSSAKITLTAIVTQFPGTPLAEKATNILNVLANRGQIEMELTNLVVTRQGDTPAPPVTVMQPKTDTIKSQPVVTTNSNPPVITPIANNNPPTIGTTPFVYAANETHYVVVVLTQVDPVFCNEAKNAFARYNKETYYNKTMTADLFEVDKDNRLVLLWPFKDAQEAVTYVEKTRPKAPTEILPWLRGGRYSLLIANDRNLDLLKTSKDIDGYKLFLKQHLPGTF